MSQDEQNQFIHMVKFRYGYDVILPWWLSNRWFLIKLSCRWAVFLLNKLFQERNPHKAKKRFLLTNGFTVDSIKVGYPLQPNQQ